MLWRRNFFELLLIALSSLLLLQMGQVRCQAGTDGTVLQARNIQCRSCMHLIQKDKLVLAL